MATKKAYTRKTTKQVSDIKSIKNSMQDTYRCTCCGKDYQRQMGNFIKSYSPLYEANNGYLPICKDCVENFYEQLLKYYNDNENQALEHCCWTFDWYYDPAVVESVKKTKKPMSYVTGYPSAMNLFRNRGSSYLDTVKRQSWRTIEPQNNHQDIAEGKEEIDEEQKKIEDEAIHMFGLGYSFDEYEYLMDEYNSWTTRHECKTKTQEELFKNICRAQVAVQRAQRRGNIKEISDATKMLQDLMQSAGLKPTQNNENSMLDQNTFGTLIKKIEKERPIAKPSEEWEDVYGIKGYIETWFLGHLCNTVHVDNDCSEAYRRELAKYTVKPPVYDDDEELGETSLLDKYSTKSEDKSNE